MHNDLQLRAGLLMRFCRIVQEADAEDACQHAFQKLAENPNWRQCTPDELMATLYTVGRNYLLNNKKKLSRIRPLEDLDAIAEQPVDLANETEVDAAIRCLPDTQRSVIARVYFAGETNAQVALALDKPVATVKTLRRRGRLRLHAILTRS